MSRHEQSWSDPKVAASHSVLVEVMTILASEIDKLVVVGGWVPELLYPGREVVNLPLHPRADEATARRSVDFIAGVGPA